MKILRSECFLPFCFFFPSRLLSKIRKTEIYEIILPLVLYRCETWPLTLSEVHMLTVFEIGVQSRIFGPKREEMTGGWRRLHNEKLHNFYA
jgi:hypothetical protein